MCEGRLLRYGREIAQVWEDADVAAQGLMYGCQQPHVQPHVWDVMCSLMYVSKHKASCMGGCCSTRPQVWEDVAAQGLRYGSMLLLQHKASAQGLMYGSQHKASCMGGCCSTRPHVWEDAAAQGLRYGRMLQHEASCMGGCCCCSTRPQVWEHAAVAARGLLTHIHNKKQVNKLNQKLHNTQPKVCKS